MKFEPKRKRKGAGASVVAKPAHAKAAPPNWQAWLAWLRTPATGAILVAMVLVTFAPTLRNQYIWDDDAYVTKNLNLRSAEGLWATWFKPFSLPQYYPLVHTTFWLEYQSWELDPVGYHVDNMLLHALGVVLAWRVLLRLGISWAWLGAALFAVHPVTVESVAWITERKNVLSEALVLASMLCYLRFAPVEPNSVDATGSRWKWINYGLALVFFLGALLSKTVVATMPAVLLVIYWWKRGRIGWRDLVPLLPFFAVGMSLGMVTAWLERIHVGAEGDEWAFTRAERVLIAGRAVWFYATKLAWPHPIIFFYPRWEIDGHEWWQYLFPAAAVAFAVALFLLRGRIGRGPLAAALVFGGVLVPAIGFFNVYPFRFSFVADHFQHHATLSLFALAAGGAALLDRRLARVNVATGETPTNTTSVSFAPSQILLRGVTGVVLVVLAVTSYVQCRTYYDVEVLYTDVMAKNPSAWIAFSNLGAHYLKEQRGEEATALLRQALAIAPRNSLTHVNYGRVMFSKGVQEGFQPGQLEDCIEHFETALMLEPRQVQARVALAQAMTHQDRGEEAKRQLNLVLERQPYNTFALASMGSILIAEKRWAEARDYFERALEYSPNSGDAQHGLGLALVNQGHNQEAIAHLQAAVQLKPDSFEVHFVLGNALYNLGDFRTAIDQYNEALGIKPDYLEALSNKGVALGQLGMADRRVADADAAIHCFEQLVKLDPQYKGAQENLKNAYDLKKLLLEKGAR